MHIEGNNKTQSPISINIELISHKQLIAQSIQYATAMFKEVIQVYCNNIGIEYPFANQKQDFSALINYIIDQSRLDKIVQNFVKEDINQRKPFVRSYLFEMKSIRNAWAHWPSENLDYRLANRAYDTLSLLYMSLNGNPTSQLYLKIQYYRKTLLSATVRKYNI